MGVYIKDMEMPFTCLTCDFHKCAGGIGDFCSLTKRRQFRFKNRPKDCPLIPVPPHGDLIDREALKAAICSRLCIKDLTYLSPAEKVIVDEINDAPVVIPAEPGEEET